MAVLQKGHSLYPFWGENIALVTGLDPLGLQVTSEAIYASLLPGVSNLTNRLRYYGFYCWLLDFYLEKEKKGNQTEQYRFIRRAELLIAIIMQTERKSITQITGSDFASGLILNNPDVFDLRVGADKDAGSERVYWKYPSGAFGQYYFGALQDLSLVVRYQNDEGNVIFNITQPHPKQKVSGKQLAVAFGQTLTEEVKSIFYQSLRSGQLSSTDIPELIQFFAIDQIAPATKEWQLYIDMLLDKDYPAIEAGEKFTFNRKNTVISLLTSAINNAKKYNWNLHLKDCYEQKPFDNDTHVGWYCYQLNEYWQFACGMILYGVLRYLESLQSEEYLPKFIQDFSELILSSLGINRAIILDDYILAITETENAIVQQKDKNNTPQESAAIGFKLLFKIYTGNTEQLPRLKEYMNRTGVVREGNMADGLMNIAVHQGGSVSDFINGFVHKNVIYRHQIVALRKMGNGIHSTHKFIIEEQMIRFVELFPARWTSPRMNALQNLLHDLQIIDEGLITELQTKILPS